jgi:hypothetical protein
LETPGQTPLPADELARLEELRQQAKDQAEAWRNFLESLAKLKAGRNNEPAKTKTTPKKAR